MKFCTRFKLFAVLALAAICITLAVVLVPPTAKPVIPGLTILDSRLHVDDCRISYGKSHSSIDDSRLHALVMDARQILIRFHARLFSQPRPVLLGSVRSGTGTNAVALVVRYTWNSAPTNLTVQMADAAGHHFPSRRNGFASMATSNVTVAVVINVIECPAPPPPRDYEFQILLGSNGPHVAKYKTTLNLK